MVGELGSLRITGQAGLGPNGLKAHRIVGLLKTMVLTMPPFSSVGIFMFLQLGKILCFKSQVWKVERTEKLMHTSNTLEGEACLITKCVGSAHFPICLQRMMF